MSDAQVKSAAKLMKNVCQPKSKVSTGQLLFMFKRFYLLQIFVLLNSIGQIEAMHKGSFPEEVELMVLLIHDKSTPKIW